MYVYVYVCMNEGDGEIYGSAGFFLEPHIYSDTSVEYG